MDFDMDVQSWAIDTVLGCMKSPPAATGSQEAGFTQPGVHFISQPCTLCVTYNLPHKRCSKLSSGLRLRFNPTDELARMKEDDSDEGTHGPHKRPHK